MNLGPLLYHYSDVCGEGSIEPTYEDLLIIIRGIGFKILVGPLGASAFTDSLIAFARQTEK